MEETNQKKGFRVSSALFNRALSVDVMEFRQKDTQSNLFQCVDSLLIAPTTEEEYAQAIEAFLETLQVLGYWVSAKKAQLCISLFAYLDYNLEEGKQMRELMDTYMFQLSCNPSPIEKQVQEFLKVLGGYQVQMVGFIDIVMPSMPSLEIHRLWDGLRLSRGPSDFEKGPGV